MIDGDIPVACCSSGVVMLLDGVVLPGPHPRSVSIEAIRGLVELGGTDARFDGRPCPSCRSRLSSDDLLEKRTLCTYRPLKGPLYVPRPFQG